VEEKKCYERKNSNRNKGERHCAEREFRKIFLDDEESAVEEKNRESQQNEEEGGKRMLLKYAKPLTERKIGRYDLMRSNRSYHAIMNFGKNWKKWK